MKKQLRRASRQSFALRQRGMTMVELLAATVLSVLLMVAVLGVLKTVTRPHPAHELASRHQAWQRRLQSTLEWDFTHSREIRPLTNGFELQGFSGRDFVTREATHCPATIRYSLEGPAPHRQLVRTEIHPHALHLNNQRLELVCVGVDQILVNAEAVVGGGGTNRPLAMVPDGEIPSHVRFQLLSSKNSDPVMSHDFVLP